jgi:hypothetical protein
LPIEKKQVNNHIAFAQRQIDNVQRLSDLEVEETLHRQMMLDDIDREKDPNV